MNFIHTADWHLGNQMHDIDRKIESQQFLIWLKKQIIAKNAETLVVAGDIFDTVNPPIEARKLYYTFLASLVETCCKNVVIIAGNHDSSAMLESSKELLDVLNIHVVGSISSFSPDFSPADFCFELKDSNQQTCGICMAVPFVREVDLRNFISGSQKCEDKDLYAVAYKNLYEQVFREAERIRGDKKIPIIATGHLYAADLEGRLAEKKSNEKCDDGMKVLDVLGTLGNVPSSVFPAADYVGLGHIHYSTMVAKNPRIRYSGSPFVMGFDEAEIPHHVLFCELTEDPAKDFAQNKFLLDVEKIQTPRTFVYKRISGTLLQVKECLENLNLSEGEEKKSVYLELCYKREIGLNAQEYLSESIKALPENVSVVSWKVLDAQHFLSSSAGFTNFDSQEIKNLDDREIFTQLILSKSGLEKDSEEGKKILEKFLPLFLQVSEES